MNVHHRLADDYRYSVSLQLQFLFELPTRLKKCIEMGFYGQAVR